MAVDFFYNEEGDIIEVIIRRPYDSVNYSYGISISLYRRPVTKGLRKELAAEIRAGVTAAAAAKKVKTKYGGVLINRNYARYTGLNSIR